MTGRQQHDNLLIGGSQLSPKLPDQLSFIYIALSQRRQLKQSAKHQKHERQ